jgi:hypothetical protein
MRPRAETVIACVLLLLLALVVIGQALQVDPDGRSDERRTSLQPTPAGAKGWADALTLLGVEVIRSRNPLTMRRDPAGKDALLAFLDPTIPFDLVEATAVRERIARGRDVLLAGRGARFAMRCLGWDLVRATGEGLVATGAVGDTKIAIQHVRETLRTLREPFGADSSRQADLGVLTCDSTPVVAVDTLLRVPSGRPAAVRVHTESGGRFILVGDGALFADTTLRYTEAGVFALALVADRYSRVVIDEAKHGNTSGGSMSRALLSWSGRSPWGWLLWQLIAVGVIALMVAMVRSGPLLVTTERQRRSPLEHVRALATALSATRGHDVALRLLIGGLRRRLSADGRPTRDDPRPWLTGLVERMRTPRGRAAAKTLQDLNRRPPSPREVLAAANAVEVVWDETRA